LRDEIDALVQMGWGAGRLRSLILQRYAGRDRIQSRISTTRQIENRRAYLVRTAFHGWEITTHTVINNSASTRTCAIREDFMASTTPATMDDLIFLDSFVLPARGAETDISFGITFTSRRVFRNAMASVTSQGDELVCATDGTYKLHFGGWTLVDCGSEAVVWTRCSFVHQFVPWAFMFVRSETTAAYVQTFQVIRQRALNFFGVDVNVAYGSLDHSEAITSAFEEVWPVVRLLTCWPHLARHARKKGLF
jgi:hypothetical protein